MQTPSSHRRVWLIELKPLRWPRTGEPLTAMSLRSESVRTEDSGLNDPSTVDKTADEPHEP